MGVAQVDTNSPYFVTRTRTVTYEFSRYEELFGSDFLAKACDVVRRQKTESGVNESTWVDNYVIRFAAFLEALSVYLYAGTPGRVLFLSGMNQSDWEQFGCWFRERIVRSSLSDKTKAKHILCTNKLMGFFIIVGLIPIKIELAPLVPRFQARDGESVRTHRGWNDKPKIFPVLSPLVLRIEKHRRSYDYSAYRKLAPRFLHSILPVLNRLYVGYSAGGAKSSHNTLVRFLDYLARRSAQQPDATFFQLLRLGRTSEIDATAWEKIIYEWRDEVLRENLENGFSLKSAHGIVMRFSFIWRHLAAVNCVPDVEIVGFKNAKRISDIKPRLSLAQLSVDAVKISEAEEKLVSRMERLTSTNERDETREFISKRCFAPTLPLAS
ncbi:MAG: hypothetical protein V4441_10055 [Pseudomonadota bacterium]